MKAGGANKDNLIAEIMRFAKAIESYGNTNWSQQGLAVRLSVTPRTVSRYLSLLTRQYGLRLSVKAGLGKNCSVIGNWSFLEALKKQYQGVKS